MSWLRPGSVATLKTTHATALDAVRELVVQRDASVIGFGEYHPPNLWDSSRVPSTLRRIGEEILPGLVKKDRVVGFSTESFSPIDNLDRYVETQGREVSGQLVTEFAIHPTGGRRYFLDSMIRLHAEAPFFSIGESGADAWEGFLAAFSSVDGKDGSFQKSVDGINRRVVEFVSRFGPAIRDSGARVALHNGAEHLMYEHDVRYGVKRPSYVNDAMEALGLGIENFVGIRILVPEIVATYQKIIEGDDELCEKAPTRGVHLKQEADHRYVLVLPNNF